jgi:2-octaprenylphenol hydroxylase
MNQADIIIVGAGIVGLTAALALAEGAPNLRILLLDSKPITPKPLSAEFDSRVFAINKASQALWQSLGVWDAIRQQRVSPYAHMQVWEAGSGQVSFQASDYGYAELGFIVEQAVIINALLAAIEKQPMIQCLGSIDLQQALWVDEHVSLRDAAGVFYQAQCLIAADGGNSWCRAQAGIVCRERSYGQQAVIATVRLATPHQATARQRFLPTGPLACLPLADPYQGSIVWSLDDAHAENIFALSDADFCAALSQAWGDRVGAVLSTSPRHRFALSARLAEHLVQPRFALVGDAAHTIHPLAGLGVNLGLQDVQCLAAVLCAAVKKDRDFAALHTLRRYERARQAEHQLLLGLMRGFKELFGSSSTGLAVLRQHGMQWVDRSAWLKRVLMLGAG